MSKYAQLLDAAVAGARITDGKRFKLAKVDPDYIGGFRRNDKERAVALLAMQVERMRVLQEKLYAQNRWGMLVVFQAMDAAGKDSTIKHVMSGINPQGCEVHPFKQPSPQELDHDFMWRCAIRGPERGRIDIFNRSYYEEVLVVRVHPEILNHQRLPERAISKHIWRDRLQDIAAYEAYLARQGYVILKVFLHISRDEQKKRFLERLDKPDKNWKFSIADVDERRHWNDYMHAYEEAIRHTAAPHAPWLVVPANAKWYSRLVVATAICDALEALKLEYPAVDPDKRRELVEVKQALLEQK